MIEGEPRRVQELTVKPHQPIAGSGVSRRPIDRVADQRMPDRVQVDADLVRPPGGEAALEQRGAREAAQPPLPR